MDPTITLPSETGEVQPEQPIGNSQSLTPLIIFLFIAIVLLGGLFTWLFLGSQKVAQPVGVSVAPTAPARVGVAVSGIVYFQGYAPNGYYIAIAAREAGHTDYQDVISGITPDPDGTTEWSWKDATKGKNYDIKATLKASGKVIEQSVVQNVSAPATSVDLPLVSNLVPPASTTATVSGQINLDGYAPNGSVLEVLAKAVGAVSFQTVVGSISAVDNANWSWGAATEGTTYLVKAQLMDANGNLISTGDTQTITAPSGGELLNVFSTAKAPTNTQGGVSGTIIINGAIQSGSYLTLATRLSGTTTFNQVASNIQATSGVAFSWNGATSGSSYDIQAYLWVSGKPYAQSNILTVTAPSTFDVLTINAQQPTSAPSGGSINVSCGGAQGGLNQATINFNTSSNLANAASYNIVVTSASQSTQVINTTVSPSNPIQSQSITTTYVFQPGATYYAQYAYATSVGGQMSPLSPSVQFACR